MRCPWLAFSWLCMASVGYAQPAPEDAPGPDTAPGKVILDRQSTVEGRYKEFETVLGRVADLLRPHDPDRAALLSKAFGQSKKDLIAVQLRDLLDQLETGVQKGDYDGALKDQEAVLTDMKTLLDLLLSEDRAERLRERRKRMEEYLKKVQELADRQKALRSQTERVDPQEAESAKRLSQSQGKLGQDAKDLADRIQTDDAKDAARDAGKPEGDSDPSEKPRGESEDSEKKPGEQGKDGEPSENSDSQSGKPSESDNPNESGKPSKSGKPSESGEPTEGQPQPGEDSQQPQSQENSTPGQKNLKAAQQAMQRAKEKLEQLKQQDASKEQDEAIKELEKTIAELEEILRQLREEERQELLANLESRLRKVLEMQIGIQEGTVLIDKVPAEERSRADEQKSITLSRRESAIVTDLDQVFSLLVEDGTAIAFPETVEQLSSDAQMVVDLLAKFQTGSYTQSVEQDIIDTLEEMIAAIQKEIAESKKRQQQPSPGGGSGKQPLVEKLAELKMIRSLQKRVNERTDRIDKLVGQGQAVDNEMDSAIRELANRQHRIYEITRDVAQGKTE